MIQVDRARTSASVLDFVRLAYATRHSADRCERGGDFIASAAGSGRLTLAIGDASAKESRGRTIARILRRSFRTSAWTASPSRILYAMSSAFLKHEALGTPSPSFAAVLVATIDLEQGVLTYAAAGVEAGLVFAAGLAHDHLHATGPLIGIEEQPVYRERWMRFLPGDSLLAYTDGVTEARVAQNRSHLGSSGLVRSMHAIKACGEPTIRALWHKIGSYTQHVYRDDATLALVTTSAAAPARGRIFKTALQTLDTSHFYERQLL